ncbi:hypothetical protein TWF281_007655 [Arthrobotrys megalospora]
MMLPRAFKPLSVGYLLAHLTSISAWQQAITTDGSSELRFKINGYGGDECHARTGAPEGVMGIMNTRNSDQLKVMAFWDVAGCDRNDPERYSLFIHWYDLPSSIQLLDLGLPGLEHRWKSFRRIDPASASWVNFKNPGKGKFIPGPSGMTPIGEFFDELIKKIPPGSIRYRIMGTNEYITVKDAIYVPKTVSTGELLIEDKLLTNTEMLEARETFRAQVTHWYHSTGGAPMHLLQPKDYIFQQRISQAYVHATTKDPGVQVVREMLAKYRYPEGTDKTQAQVDAANQLRESLEKLQQQEMRRRYERYLQSQISQMQKYQNSMTDREKKQENLDQSQPTVYPPQFYGQMMGTDFPQMNDMMSGYPLSNDPKPQAQPKQEIQQPQTKADDLEQFNNEEKFNADFAEAIKGLEAYTKPYIPPPEDLRQPSQFTSGSYLENSLSPTRQSLGSRYPRRQPTVPTTSQTCNNIDRSCINILDEQYLRQREALKSKSLNELDLEYGDIDVTALLGLLGLGSLNFDLGIGDQNRWRAQANVDQLVPSLGQLEEEVGETTTNIQTGAERTQENDEFLFEEEEKGIDKFKW